MWAVLLCPHSIRNAKSPTNRCHSSFSRSKLQHCSFSVPDPHTPNGTTFLLDHTRRETAEICALLLLSLSSKRTNFMTHPNRQQLASWLKHTSKITPARTPSPHRRKQTIANLPPFSRKPKRDRLLHSNHRFSLKPTA